MTVSSHNLTKSRLYCSWLQMVKRCYDAEHKQYKDYGGRGIRVCEFLRASPTNLFLLLGERPPRLTIDRIDNSKGYQCGSCSECLRLALKLNVRWATYKEQNRNRRDNVWLTLRGETWLLSEWARKLGLSTAGLKKRLKNDIDPFKPNRVHNSRKRKEEPFQHCL